MWQFIFLNECFCYMETYILQIFFISNQRPRRQAVRDLNPSNCDMNYWNRGIKIINDEILVRLKPSLPQKDMKGMFNISSIIKRQREENCNSCQHSGTKGYCSPYVQKIFPVNFQSFERQGQITTKTIPTAQMMRGKGGFRIPTRKFLFNSPM